ncbi:unnamed protein product [Bursaphelenchus okinawaensis]|uniref:Snurportin-1 n=1 Tax=Bursaphelenchus okinawaensis TaxID=465554 RepID=A0A811KAE4_9BILA|nr:unnamed protein product [Bursaphelenchus okinawaensis]CAG9096110.1 unnamed protein product [Bursaphelenchus okinawaensis]
MSQETPRNDIESLSLGFLSTVEVTENHSRYMMYKNFGTLQENQRKRRNDVIQRQREARMKKMEEARTTAEPVEEEQDEDTDGFMEVDRRRRTKSQSEDGDKRHRAKFHRNDMKGRLMYSEWLIDIPEDISENWLALPAPAGKRVLVLAEHQYTFIYDKKGSQLSRFKSTLNNRSQTSLIDGILTRNTIYVIDYLTTNDLPLEECEYDCRRMMGSSFLRENGVFNNSFGQFKFVELPAVKASKEELTKLMAQTYDYELDGILFYYTKCHYYSGQTPLAVWLKPWMMPEILGVSINPIYQKETGQTPQEFISEFHKKHPTYGLPITRKEHRQSETEH